MAEAVEPVVEEPVIEEPVVEEPVVDTGKSEQMVEAIANDDSGSADSAFNESWTRNEMVKWMKARGHSVQDLLQRPQSLKWLTPFLTMRQVSSNG